MELNFFSFVCLLSFVRVSQSGYSSMWNGGYNHNQNPSSNANKPWTQVPAQLNPEFESTAQRIIVSPGQTALLPCRVRNLADKVVSWIRSRDLHIISSGGFMFTGDSRFRVVHPDGDSAAWGLQLRNTRDRDQGLYECQVNTDPKMKRAIFLSVRDKSGPLGDMSQKDDSTVYGDDGTATIVGPKEKYVKVGSSITLTCNFKLPPSSNKPTLIVDWLHGDQTFDQKLMSGRGGGVPIVWNDKDGSDVTSRLTLLAVHEADTGKYTCKPFFGRPATATIIVIDGEHSEAMQGEVSSAQRTTGVSSVIIILLSVIFNMLRYD